jgi:hypothetical protein
MKRRERSFIASSLGGNLGTVSERGEGITAEMRASIEPGLTREE